MSEGQETEDFYLGKVFKVIHTRVLHWNYGQKPEDETREKER